MYKIHILIMQHSCGCNVPKIVQHKSETETVRVIVPEPCPDCQETKKEWQRIAEETIAKCNELERENAALRRFKDNGISCFMEPCPNHGGINTLLFDQFMAMYGGRCLACEVDKAAELERKNAELVQQIEWLRRKNASL